MYWASMRKTLTLLYANTKRCSSAFASAQTDHSFTLWRVASKAVHAQFSSYDLCSCAGWIEDYQVRVVATLTQKRICVYVRAKYMGRFYHKYDGFLMLCVLNVSTLPILSKSNFDRICDDVGITSS